ncbi:2-C-methyl-D-erythritol 2,4-cyclodiphosphate synthase [candidate division GN15 bacterium]|nr:2-C-methyl-D-erythritol 2,4-cyclodiphosphate synthase [candidate division GN15 bacterium]
MDKLRIGHGFDVHRFADDRPLILGGVTIDYSRGLAGHSDADVLLHAIADALLGAAGLEDIGHHFPPSDSKWKDADSSDLLAQVVVMIREAGVTGIINVDAVIMAEQPKLKPHIASMRQRISELLHITPDRVGVKATTTEQLGFVGREEGIAASAVCLLARDD